MSNPFETSRETLKERTDVLLRSGELSDCVFIVGENEVKIVAHKIFMAMSSPAFYAMFYGDIAEKTDTVRIKDIESSAFKGMLQYIYTDKVDFESCSHACLVYLSAKKYLLPFLEAQCEFYVETNVEPSTACEIYEWSKFHCIENIEEVCLKLFKENTEEVIVSQAFLDCDYSTVLTIAKMEELNLNSELKLFEAVEKWAINEAFRRGVSLEMLSSEMTDIISHIRFLSLSADEFTASQVNITTQGLTPLLSTEEKLAIVMNITHPGITPLPKRISDVSSPRKPKPPPVEPVPMEEEWSLRRECEDGALFPVTKWCNPFTRKGITVNRKIKVKGVKIGTQKKVSNLSSSNENVEMYQEKVTVVLKKDWSLKFFGSLYHSMTPYDSEVQINFNKPVPLEPNKLYWLIVNFDKGGTYSFLRDTHLVYNTHNLEIKMTEDFSAVTEIFFLDNEHNNSDTIACSNSCMIPPARAITAPSTSNSPSAVFQTFMTNQTRRNSGSNSNSPSTPPSPSSPPT